MITLVLLSLFSVTADAAAPTCAIDMGSNSFRRIVGAFEDGRYSQRNIEIKTLGVGDDVAKNGRISDAKLAEIERALAAFKSACEKEGAAPVVAIGTAAFRDAPNGHRAVEIASKVGVSMEIATERRESELAYLVGSLGQDGFAVIDNGSRSVELVAKGLARRSGGAAEAAVALRHHVFNLGYRQAYEKFFAAATDPAAAVLAFRTQLLQQASNAAFMNSRKTLVGVEFGEMATVLFEPAALEGRVLTLAQLKKKLDEITVLRSDAFQAFKQKKDIDRALPRLVVAATLTEAFGYSQMLLTERELGTGLIIEAGLKNTPVPK